MGFPDPFNPLPYLQVAQLFHNTTELFNLDKVTIVQLFFDNLKLAATEHDLYVYTDNYRDGDSFNGDNGRAYKYMDIQNATFRIRVYRADDAGYPAEDLCNEEITVSAENSSKIVANLSKYKIMIPKRDFFVAIQWLPNIYNASQITYNTFSTTKMTSFKPFVGVEPINGNDPTFFVKDYAGNWQKSMDEAKLAITITGNTE